MGKQEYDMAFVHPAHVAMAEVKQVILLPGSVLHVPSALVDSGGRSPCENSLAVPPLARSVPV